MSRNVVTIPFTPSRRPVYRQAGIVGQEQGAEAANWERSTQDWVQDRNQRRLAAHLDARSNSGDGRDSITATGAGQRFRVVSLGAGLQIRVQHQLNRVPSAVLWFQSTDPNYRIIGTPAGQTGGFPNAAWTSRDVWLNTNAPAGVVFDVSIG